MSQPVALDAWEATGRRFLAGEPVGTPVLRIHSPAPVVACLVTAGRILPLVQGRQRVGRGAPSRYAVQPDQLAGVLEGAQWILDVRPGSSRIQDASSTSGAVLLRGSQRDLAGQPLGELQGLAGVRRLGWDGSQGHEDAVAICSGDVLVNVYGVFVYCEPEARGAGER